MSDFAAEPLVVGELRLGAHGEARAVGWLVGSGSFGLVFPRRFSSRRTTPARAEGSPSALSPCTLR